MPINIFEGSRRIALLAAGLASAGTIAVVVTDDPYLSVAYSVARPGSDFVRRVESCPSDGTTHYFSTMTRGGRSVAITLCILPMPFGDDAQQLIPYKIDDKGMIWGAAPYSREVSDYERQLERKFVLPEADEAWVDGELSRLKGQAVTDGVKYLLVGLAVFAGCVWSIGWIARGFLGIPRGMDRRPL